MRLIKFTLFLILLYTTTISVAQKKVTLDSVSIAAAQFRSVGPAFMTGRISDVVIDPADENHWYVGVDDSGVAGATRLINKPDQFSFSSVESVLTKEFSQVLNAQVALVLAVHLLEG